MTMRLGVVAAVVAGVCVAGQNAYGMGRNLRFPSIAVPAGGEGKEPDSVVSRLAGVLREHRKDYTGGSFLNSHSVLYFGGGTAGVNALLADLAKVEGAEVHVRLAKGAGVTRLMFPDTTGASGRPCDCEVDHLAWGGSPRSLTVTIYLGGGRIDPETLQIPPLGAKSGPDPTAGPAR